MLLHRETTFYLYILDRRDSQLKYDYLVVGAGLFGATFARQAREAGKTVLVVDRRDHIAGNVYTSRIEGINVHSY
ncbi:MAG: NAD(P)-binding protein, partial [Clostridia bacterium]|nr:NAD(P)-binding protein [Clostridia bacterium]